MLMPLTLAVGMPLLGPVDGVVVAGRLPGGGDVTGGDVRLGKVRHPGALARADIDRQRAARVERAAGRRVDRTWDLAGEPRSAQPPGRVRLGMGLEQGAGVRMAWRPEDVGDRARLDDP